ncbi:MAG: hypothetical protein A2X94_01605 [Bdellovibrionales bacterium GWB1_55_8]|nr:MAG: hypothetical protein A2X94_01605 [Bdellovibrionales bacterium GWB1_55_8]
MALLSSAVGAFTLIVTVTGCSTIRGEKSGSGEELAASGPTVVDVQVQPETVELNQQNQLNAPAAVVAQVQDIRSDVTNVTIRFLNAPVELPMEHVSGTSWRAEIPTETVQRLAINNQTTTYQANIYARNADGEVGVSREPIDIAIKAPNVTGAG